MRHAVAAAAITLCVTGSAFAQEAPAPPPAPTDQGPGPLVIERVHTPFIVAPEYKFTEMDHHGRQLIGGQAGWLLDEQLFVGGAGYWMADGSRDAQLTYGGFLIGWTTAPEHRMRFGGRGLIGGGTATLATDVTVYPRGFDPRFDPRFNDPRVVRFGGGPQPAPVPTTIRFRGRDDFMVFEPQGNVTTALTDHIGIDASVGYRWTAFSDFVRDRVDGVTGALALQFGW